MPHFVHRRALTGLLDPLRSFGFQRLREQLAQFSLNLEGRRTDQEKAHSISEQIFWWIHKLVLTFITFQDLLGHFGFSRRPRLSARLVFKL